MCRVHSTRITEDLTPGTTFAPEYPADVVAGDLLLLLCQSSLAETFSDAGADWVQIDTRVSSNRAQQVLLARLADGSESEGSASAALTFASTPSNNFCGVVACVKFHAVTDILTDIEFAFLANNVLTGSPEAPDLTASRRSLIIRSFASTRGAMDTLDTWDSTGEFILSTPTANNTIHLFRDYGQKAGAVGTFTINLTTDLNNKVLYTIAVPAQKTIGIGDELAMWCPSLDDDNDGTTTLKDFGSGAVDGMISNPAAWLDDTDVGGVRCVNFDALYDVSLGTILVDDPLQLNYPATICFWNLWNATGTAFERIYAKSDGANAANGWDVWRGSNLNNFTARFTFGTAGNYWFPSDNVISDESWFHGAIVFDGVSTPKIYVDGIERTVTTGGGSPALPPNVQTNMKLGQWNHSSVKPLKGRGDDFRIFDRILQPQEIHALSHSRAYQGPVVKAIGTVAEGASGTTVTTNKPANTAVGDLLILAISYRNGAFNPETPATPTNWELIGNTNDTSSNGELTNTYLYRRIADGSADDEPTVVGFGAGYGWHTRMVNVINFDPTNPIGAAVVTEATANPAPLPVATAAADNSLGLVWGISARGGSGSTITWPTGYHENYFDANTGLYRCFISQSQVTLDDTEATGGDSNGWLGTTSYPTQQIAFVVNPIPPPVAGGPPVFEGFSTAGVNNTGSGVTPITLNVPTGTQSGDLLLAFSINSDGVANDPRTHLQTPAGWQVLDEWVSGGNTNGLATAEQIFYREADGTEPASYDFVPEAGYSRFGMAMVRVSGAGPVGAIVTARNSDGSSGSATSPAITPPGANSLIIRHSGPARYSESGTGAFTRSTTEYNISESNRVIGGWEVASSDPGTDTVSFDPTWWAEPQLSNLVVAIPAGAPPAAQPRVIPVLRGTGSMGRGQ